MSIADSELRTPAPLSIERYVATAQAFVGVAEQGGEDRGQMVELFLKGGNRGVTLRQELVQEALIALACLEYTGIRINEAAYVTRLIRNRMRDVLRRTVSAVGR